MKEQAEKEIEMPSEIMNKLHQCSQEILDVFVQICKENDLKYYLIAGSLLGAVRHKGPIPWDNDIDVGMPRADFEKFKQIMLSRPEGETYHIHCQENDPNFSVFLARLMKRGTVYNAPFLEYRNLRFYEIWLDIFPLDNAPVNSGIRYKLLGKKIAIMKRLIHNKVQELPSRSLQGNVLHFFIKRFSIDSLYGYAERLMRKYENIDCKYYVGWASQYSFLKQTMPKEWYEPGTELLYNGKHYNAPSKWDKVLTQLYNNYMELPPEHERKIHNATEIKV